MRDKISRFMVGRYGFDQLSNFFIVVILVCMVTSMLTGKTIFSTLGFLLLIVMYYRILSRNFSKRQAENQKYLNIRYVVTKEFRSRRMQFTQRKDYRFFKCPSCSQTVRVPRGHGRICITCPKCRMEFIKES